MDSGRFIFLEKIFVTLGNVGIRGAIGWSDSRRIQRRCYSLNDITI